MKLAFFNNSLNHHQVNVADELYKILGDDYVFITTIARSQIRFKGGANFDTRPYCLCAGDDADARKKAMEYARTAEVCVFGMSSLDYAIERAKYNKKALSFELGERWLKKGLLNILSPHLLRWWFTYQRYFRNANFYKLNSSAFGGIDHYRMFSYRNRCYKWGYFTKVDDNFKVEASSQGISTSGITSLMWCARFLKLKHPELPVQLAARLKQNGYKYTIDMFGSGDEFDNTKKLIEDLGVKDRVNLCGNRPNEEILKEMRKHDIFLFTSDRHEGWGAVSNESMSNGCVLVGADAIGSIPYLIQDGVNGMIFKSGSLDSLYTKVKYLIDNPQERLLMSKNGVKTMHDVWSPACAANNLLTLIDDLLNGRESSIKEGPCSKA